MEENSDAAVVTAVTVSHAVLQLRGDVEGAGPPKFCNRSVIF